MLVHSPGLSDHVGAGVGFQKGDDVPLHRLWGKEQGQRALSQPALGALCWEHPPPPHDSALTLGPVWQGDWQGCVRILALSLCILVCKVGAGVTPPGGLLWGENARNSRFSFLLSLHLGEYLVLPLPLGSEGQGRGPGV